MRETFKNNVVVLDKATVESLAREARDLASGELDSVALREKIFQSALEWLLERELRIRRAGNLPKPSDR